MKNFRDFTPLLVSGSPAKLLERATRTNQGRTYRGVTIVKAGPGNKADNNFYPAETLKEAVKQKMFEGLRAFADHPTAVDEHILPERSIRDFVGVYTNTRFKESKSGYGGEVRGDLTILPSADWLSSNVDQLIALGQHDKIGLSINGSGKTVPKKVSLSESGELEDVNYLESFHALKSADVVTEAGAGGGFQRILESAKAARGISKMQLTAEQQKKLNEATAKGDPTVIQALLTEFNEANANGGGNKKKTPATPEPKPKAGESGEEEEEGLEESNEGEESDAPEDEDDENVPDPDAELDAAAEELAEAGAEDPEEDDDDSSNDGQDEDGVDEDDEDEEDDDVQESEDANDKLKQTLLAGAKRVRAAAKSSSSANKKTLEAEASRMEEGARLLEARGGRGKKKLGKSNAGGKGNLGNTVKGKVTVPGPSKWKTAESARERINELETALKETLRSNKIMANQLAHRQSIDRAKKLLKESAIPAGLRSKILPELVGLTERKMQARIAYHESLADTILESVRGAADDDGFEFDPIEGAGSRTLRESGFGGGRGDINGDSFFEEVGLPLKQ